MSDTTTVLMYGASDDCIEIEGAIEGAGEYYTTDCTDFALVAPNGDQLFLHIDYGIKPESEWTIRIENSTTHPSWPMHFTHRPAQSDDPALALDVPVGTRLVCRNGFTRN